jgi:hypothetical protein
MNIYFIKECKMFKKIISIILISSFSFMTIGCGQKEYYSAVKSQNETITQLNLIEQQKEREADLIHEQRMAEIMKNSMIAAAKTPDMTDDVLIPVLFMNMENQRTMAKALVAQNKRPIQLQPIKAPDSFGDNVKKSAGLILGVGGLILGITQSNNMKDIAVAGMNAAGTKIDVSGNNNDVVNDSYKNGTDNVVNGNNNEIYGKSCPDCETDKEPGPGTSYETCSDEWVAENIPGCSSCDSYYAGRCSVRP